MSLASVCHAAPEKEPVSVICVEADTGLVLHEKHVDVPRPPASMVKMIQLLLVAEGLEAGRWTLETPVTVSKRAQHMGGTQVYVEAGEVWPLGQLMRAVAVASANDAAMAVAEGLWGSEEAYRKAANARALELDMDLTVFHSVHGLPPDAGEALDQSTARDMARLACEAVRHPQVLEWVGQKEIRFRPQDAIHYNTNKLLWRMEDCDGLKTGYIRAAKFCITATAQRNGIRLISVVMGSPSKYGRFNLAQEMMEEGFKKLKRIHAVQQGQPAGEALPVAGHSQKVQLVADKDIWVIILNGNESTLEFYAERPDTLVPPIAAGTVVGELQIELGGVRLGRSPLSVPVDLPPTGPAGKPPGAALATE